MLVRLDARRVVALLPLCIALVRAGTGWEVSSRSSCNGRSASGRENLLLQVKVDVVPEQPGIMKAFALSSSGPLPAQQTAAQRVAEATLRSGGPAGTFRCLDDPEWKDPVWKASCADWRGYQCSLLKFAEELQGACPVTCGVCDPEVFEQQQTSTTTSTTKPSDSAGLPKCADLELSGEGYFQAACAKWKGHDCSGYSFSAKLEKMCPEECGLCLAA